jgi:hypothetical protein
MSNNSLITSGRKLLARGNRLRQGKSLRTNRTVCRLLWIGAGSGRIVGNISLGVTERLLVTRSPSRNRLESGFWSLVLAYVTAAAC